MLTHFLAESVLLAAVSGAIGLGIAWVAVRALVVAGPADIPRLAELRVDAPTIAFAVAVTAFVALVTSVIPALSGAISRSNPMFAT